MNSKWMIAVSFLLCLLNHNTTKLPIWQQRSTQCSLHIIVCLLALIFFFLLCCLFTCLSHSLCVCVHLLLLCLLIVNTNVDLKLSCLKCEKANWSNCTTLFIPTYFLSYSCRKYANALKFFTTFRQSCACHLTKHIPKEKKDKTEKRNHYAKECKSSGNLIKFIDFTIQKHNKYVVLRADTFTTHSFICSLNHSAFLNILCVFACNRQS